VRVKDAGIIYDATAAPSDGRSSAFTSLTRLANGDLLVAFRVGTGRDAPDGRLRIMRSADEGHTWQTLHPGLTATIDGIEGNLYAGYFTEIGRASGADPLIGHPETTPRDDEGVERLHQQRVVGRLLGAFLWVDRSNPELSFVNAETAGVLPMRALLADSPDGGATWNDFREVDLRPQVACSVTGPIFDLPGGALALPYESWKEYNDPTPGEHIASLRLSFDGGETWPEMATVAAEPGSPVFYWDQRIAGHPVTGRLVTMFWTHDRDAATDIDNHIAWGSPDGREWSAPVPTGWRGQHCQPLPVGGDRVVALYVQRHDPPSLRAVLSEDFGRTWRRDEEIAFYQSEIGPEPGGAGQRDFEDFWQDMMAWRFGHPRGVQLPNGDLFVAFYAGDAAATSMRWARVEL
jgi:hypothetical protein